MKKLGKAIFIASICTSLFATNVTAQVKDTINDPERRDLILLVDEINYLMGKVEHMRVQHQHKKGRLKFNYPALMKQLTAAKQNTIMYLNSKGEIINKIPPVNVNQDARIYK